MVALECKSGDSEVGLMMGTSGESERSVVVMGLGGVSGGPEGRSIVSIELVFGLSRVG